ncbi:MAG: DUF411 domain-containing protein [Pseudomonadota bacterium]
MMSKLKLSALAAGVALLGGGAFVLTGLPSPARAADMTVYKSESCGCCAGWVEHMRQAGYTISVVAADDLTPVKTRHGVPQDLWGCHTALVDGKVIEGHVPAAAIAAFLKAPGAATGLAVPGMPVGSPGMETPGYAPEPYDVVTFGAGRPARFMTFRGVEPIGS